MSRRGCFIVALGTSLTLLSPPVLGGPAEPDSGQVRSSVAKALPLIQASLKEYPRHRDCFSCHHQAVPSFALTVARDRGLSIDAESLDAALDVTLADLEGAFESYRKGDGQGGGATRAGYALWTLELLGHPPDETTEAVAGFLLARDRDLGYWRPSSNRPPTEASPFTTTLVALRGIRAFGPKNEESEKRLELAGSWVRRSEPQDHEERVFRLLALHLLRAEDEVRSATDALLATQNADGGWSQLPGRPSDAYATGSALVALHTAGGLATTDPAYRRGLSFLIADQLEDGSWHVASRSKPFQPYFESGFPHGPDQFLSIAASSWAVAALAMDLPLTSPSVPPQASPPR